MDSESWIAKRPTIHDPRFTKKGFSLLEVLLAVLLLGTGLVFLLQVLNTGLLAGSFNENEIIAANLVQEMTEQVRNTAYANISAGTVTESPVSGFSVFNRATTVVNNTPVASMKQVTVTVSWYVQQKQTSLSTVSYVSDV